MIIYLIIINIIAFFVMGEDKRRARIHRWRIQEKVLFVLALVGGAAGSILGMITFHHKTQKIRFAVGMPLILVLNIICIYAFYNFLK